MSLTSDLQKACERGLGTHAVDVGSCPEVAKAQSEAIISFLQKQTFTIVELKAILEVEEIQTVAPLTADVMPTVNYITATGAPAPLINSKNGVTIPKLDLSNRGGQGGLMISKGHAYVGRNPVSPNETNENNTQVKLINIKKGTE